MALAGDLSAGAPLADYGCYCYLPLYFFTSRSFQDNAHLRPGEPQPLDDALDFFQRYTLS